MPRHERSIAWSVADPAHREILQGGLDALRYPLGRVRRKTGRKIPLAIADTSRFNAAVGSGHFHVGDDHEHPAAHGLGDPNRAAALGLYWLPTAEHPAGRVEVGIVAMGEPDLAREVLIAELWHCVQYTVLSDEQRRQIVGLFEHVHAGHEHHGEFEEAGEQDYWAWRGERGMALFGAAYAPSLPRPLEARQPWHHSYDASDVRAFRRILSAR
jgi:hypothetical protein